MIILRQREYTKHEPYETGNRRGLDPSSVKINEEAANLPTTKEDLNYVKKGMEEYIRNIKAAPYKKNFRVLDKGTGEWRNGTKEDVKNFLSPEALKEQHKSLLYESKLKRSGY